MTFMSFGQIGPKENFEQVLKNKNLKSLKTMYYRSVDTTQLEGRLLLKKEFNSDGNITFKYIYTFWDVVSYNHSSTFKYDENGNLVDKTIIQEILNLGKRDDNYIKALGADPINEKTTYEYNNSNQLILEHNYVFSEVGFDYEQNPTQTIKYEYLNGKLANETSSTSSGMVIYQNYISDYQYDKDGQKIMEVRTFTTSPMKYTKTSTFIYNETGLLKEEKRVDSANKNNNRHIRYIYDNEERETEELRFSEKDSSWINSKTYNYDSKGHLVLGDEETTFEYYPDGLIKQELWQSSRTDETVNFITTYEFY